MAPLRSLIQEFRATLTLAIPLMAGQLSQMLMGVLDSAMVGQVGVVPLAASAFANSVLGVPMLLGIGLLACVSVRVAQAHGAGDRAETGEALRHGLALSVVAGFVLALSVWGLSFFLDRFGQPADVAAESRGFFILLGWSLIPMLASLALKQFSESLHHPWPPMFIFLGSVPLNAALNWLLIYGNLGFPAMGLLGAGWSTLIARCVGLVALWIYVRRARRFANHAPPRWLDRLSWEKLWALARIGVPTAGMLVLESSAFSVGAIMMGWFGAVALAAHQITLSCAATTFMLPLGVALATTIRVGQAVGAGDARRVRLISLSALGLGVAIMAICGVLIAFGRFRIATVFVDDPAVIAVAAGLLIAVAIFQIFDGAQVVAAGALRGMADVNVPVILCVIAYWLIGLPSSYLLAFNLGFGPQGIWMGLVAGLGFAAVLLSARVWWKTRVRS